MTERAAIVLTRVITPTAALTFAALNAYPSAIFVLLLGIYFEVCCGNTPRKGWRR